MPPTPDRAAPEPTDEAADPAVWLERHGDALYRFARARVGRREAAEDLVQEALLAALRSVDRYRGDSAARTWLLGILRRKIADFYRRERAAGATIEADLAGPRDGGSSPFDARGHWRDAPAKWRSPEAALDEADFWRVFEGCTSRLPGHLARAFLLREVEGVDVDRLLADLRINAGNLRIRLHRARLLLRACLEKHWFDADSDGPSRHP